MTPPRSDLPDPDPSGTRTPAPTPAATVVIVRDDPGGLQVLMQERALASDFVGGAWVFPGGKVDPRDGAVDADRLEPGDLDGMHRVMGAATTDETLALLVAAIRETFEEAGLFLAMVGDRPVDSRNLAAPAWVEARTGLAERGRDFDWRPFLAEHDIVLSCGLLRPLAWWITPHGIHRRFSTRFFVAACPTGQDPAGHDDVEMTGTVWTTPRDALAAAARGERTIIFPTRTVLASLQDLSDVDAVIDHADRGGFDLRPILPLVRPRDGSLRVQHPDGGPHEAV